MKFHITYCGAWSYKPAAVSLAAKLKSNFGEDATLEVGSGGIFDVFVDGERVYSKHETHEFPDEDALIADIQARDPA